MAATYEGVKPFDSDAAYDALVAFDAAELYESALLYDAIIPYDDAGGTYLYDDPRLLYDGTASEVETGMERASQWLTYLRRKKPVDDDILILLGHL